MAAKNAQSQAKNSSVRKNAPSSKARGVFPAVSGHRLAGKVAVVTGGSKGIGHAIAECLVREGCRVVISGRDKGILHSAARQLQQVASASPAEVVALPCDVREEADVRKLFEQAGRKFGRIDILVNSAGIFHTVTPVAKTSLELWRNVIDTNLTGTFLCSREALPLIKNGGTIINVLSVAAKLTFTNFAAYNASKQGALGFTRTLRQELIPRGIRVVALMPGATDTDMWEQFWADAPREKMMDVASIAQAALYAVLLPPNANLSELMVEPTAGPL